MKHLQNNYLRCILAWPSGYIYKCTCRFHPLERSIIYMYIWIVPGNNNYNVFKASPGKVIEG